MEFVIKELKSVNNPCSIHGIYPYRGKIAALDAEQILAQMPKGSTVLDPFCGSGTIVYEGLKFGLHTIGVDANPIAIALSNGKIHIPSPFSCVQKEVETYIHKAETLSSVPTAAAKSPKCGIAPNAEPGECSEGSAQTAVPLSRRAGIVLTAVQKEIAESSAHRAESLTLLRICGTAQNAGQREITENSAPNAEKSAKTPRTSGTVPAVKRE